MRWTKRCTTKNVAFLQHNNYLWLSWGRNEKFHKGQKVKQQAVILPNQREKIRTKKVLRMGTTWCCSYKWCRWTLGYRSALRKPLCCSFCCTNFIKFQVFHKMMMRPNPKKLNKYMKAVELETPMENSGKVFFVYLSTSGDR